MDTLSKQQLKQEFPPLLDAGIKHMSLSMLRTIAVEPFPTSVRRPMLYGNLDVWASKAADLGMKGEIWIDGSFVTNKVDPDDIDCVLIIDSLPNPTDEVVRAIDLHIDKQLVRTSYALDLYPIMRTDPNAIDLWIPYWRGWFGFERDGITAKGIARIEI